MLEKSKVFVLLLVWHLCYVSGGNSKSKFGELMTNKVFLRKAARGAIMQRYMDQTVNPCDDFYEFSCGNWPKINPKQKDIASYNAFLNVQNKITDYIIQLLSKPTNRTQDASTGLNNTAETKARNYYRSCINSNIFQYRKINEYVELIKSIGGCPALDRDWDVEKFDWVKMIAHIRSYDVEVFISEKMMAADTKNDTDAIVISEAEVGLLPLSNDDNSKSRAYMLNELLIKRLLIIYGVGQRQASKKASNIMAFMTKLLTAIDADEEYNFESNNEPGRTVPQINWDDYFTIVTGKPLNNSKEVLIMTPLYLQRLPALILRSDFETVANYIAIKFLYHLHVEYVYKQYPENMCATLVHEYMTPIVDSMYVRKFYSKQTENEVLEMIEDIRDTFRTILNETDWLDTKTRGKALEKLNATVPKVGLTESILSLDQLELKYKDLTIDPDNYYINNLKFRYYKNSQEHSPQRHKVNRSAVSDVNTVEVNAYYDPEENMIIIPAGIILPPLYHKHLPKAYTYGTIGYVVGHELTHGFDDTGRKYDKSGNEVDWWTKKASRAYQKRADCMIEQYNNYTMPDLQTSIDGEQTLGENIADNGGLRESYFAYKLWFERNVGTAGAQSEVLPGLNMTNTQLFFLSFAQGFCDHLVQTDLRSYTEDEHTINRYRIIGSLSNFEEFSKEFSCPEGSRMNPTKKCRVW